MRSILIIISLLLLSSTSSWAKSKYKIETTSLEKCKKTSHRGDTRIDQCQSNSEYHVYLEKMDIYSGVIVQHKRSKYNILELLNEIPAGKCTVGAATQVSGKSLKWVYRDGNLVALAVTVSGIDILSESKKRQFATCLISVDERKHSTVLGLAESRDEITQLLNLYL